MIVTMRAWLVRAGRHGEQEQFCLDNACCVVGWDKVPDLAVHATREDMAAMIGATYDDDVSPKKITNHIGQLWAFSRKISIGDLVVLPLKQTPSIAIGRVTGDYEYVASNPATAVHTRPVEWLVTDIPRTSVKQDLLYSLGAFMTVCEIKRNAAAQRLEAISKTRKDPGSTGMLTPSTPAPESGEEGPSDETSEETAEVDIERLARDRIASYIAEHFTGHDLARLVEAVLGAEGFTTFRSPPGADGGVDVLAGAGALGMESPRICVQVKSGDSPVDVKVVRELHGVLTTVNADQGLLVAWAGLNKAADVEARSQFFKIRVWTADDVIEAVAAVYERLPDDLQAELPLKRVWTLALDPGL